ncbi:hypothetical protein COU18_01065 [Candidatus Kaiserbacteria bacterium CG10_big_fil_rev_8_21_14_0_10_51_14]|uniref:Thioredoxin domain-containing protein n=1 Tax=Candidatus Kaiserbacteria bacterium CG10_big_fil_rev_8_21_14_0_10_51_14 TaxID=1974610 RepID=A0A2H0UC56_9BACT|nr:MAG: hypothetical protein COU18_01065 [Candidatus Kaiserbacteria bacterium CG10_big_fil_rev_8_21_14_0_10_51_14]
MNNIIWWIVGAIVLVGGGFFLFQDAATDSAEDVMMKEDAAEGEMMKGDEAMMEKTDDTMMGDEEAMTEHGSYEAYAPEKLAKASSGNVVLYFHADWCPICRGLEADINANISSLPSDLTILKIDYDTASALKQKYGVTYQHTFVQVDAEGNQIAKWGDATTLAHIIQKIR